MRFTDLQGWLDWQSGLHPKSIDLGLDRVQDVYARMGSGRPAPHVISVAGTNGKGSTVAMLDAILRADGYRVGRYTSPHIYRYNERICLQGEAVSDVSLCEAFEAVDQARGEISLTYFEFGTLAALQVFAQANLDVVLLEVGLGGRLDAVNVIDADVAIITSIDLDHTDWLGDSRESIALEKMGIARPGKPLIVGDAEPPETLLAESERRHFSLNLLGRDFGYLRDGDFWNWWFGNGGRRHTLPIPALRGNHQLANASSVLAALECLKASLPVTQTAAREGLQAVNLPGRFEVRSEQQMILDVAHNPQATQTLADNLRSMHTPGEIRAVVAMLEDKDSLASLESMKEIIDEWYVADLHVSRGGSAMVLRDSLNRLGVSEMAIHCYDSVESALNTARQGLAENDWVVVFGSFFTVESAGNV